MEGQPVMAQSQPDVWIAAPLPDLDCAGVPYRRFTVLSPDPHRFDGDKDGIGCENRERRPGRRHPNRPGPPPDTDLNCGAPAPPN